MSAQGDIATFIKAITGMSALTTRIYWDDFPENETFPCVVLQQVTGDMDVAHSGDMGGRMIMVQVDCYAATAKVARDIRKLIEDACAAYKGTMTATTVDSLFASNMRSSVTDTPAGRIFQASVDLEMSYH